MYTEFLQNHFAKSLKDKPDMLTPEEVRAILHLANKRTVYKLIKDGKINAIRVSQYYKIPKQCVIDYLIENSTRK